MTRCVILVTLIISLLTVSAPAHGAGTRLVSLVTCEQVIEPDKIPKGVRTQFNKDSETIHAVAVFENAASGIILKGSWVAVDAIETPNYTIDSADVRIAADGDATAHFSVSKPSRGWPSGNYRFELSMGKQVISVADFSINAQTTDNSSKTKPAKSSNQASDNTAVLIGCWQCETAYGLAALIFHTPDILSQDGVQYQYSLVPGAIRISDGYQFADYRYQTDGHQLAAVYPDGSQIYCMRSDCSTLVTSGGGNQGGGGNTGGQASGGDGSVVATPDYGGGSWETESDRQYYDDSAGYGGGAYENPDSGYYDYSND